MVRTYIATENDPPNLALRRDIYITNYTVCCFNNKEVSLRGVIWPMQTLAEGLRRIGNSFRLWPLGFADKPQISIEICRPIISNGINRLVHSGNIHRNAIIVTAW
jgi:hypothetical protein